MLKVPERYLPKIIRRHLPHAVTIRDTARPDDLSAAAFYAPYMPLTMHGTITSGTLPGGHAVKYPASVVMMIPYQRKRTWEEIELLLTEMGLWCLENVGDIATTDLILPGHRREFSYEGQWATIHEKGKDVVYHFRSQTMATGFKIAFG